MAASYHNDVTAGANAGGLFGVSERPLSSQQHTPHPFDRGRILYNIHLIILCTIATSGFLTALECTKLVFDRDSATDSAGRTYCAARTLWLV